LLCLSATQVLGQPAANTPAPAEAKTAKAAKVKKVKTDLQLGLSKLADPDLAAIAKATGVEREGGRIVVPRLPIETTMARRKFFFERVEGCLEDACTFAGGQWVSDFDNYGCRFDTEGKTDLEIIAMVLAYQLAIQECNPTWSAIRGVWDMIF
jgi:hypothetical protein